MMMDVRFVYFDLDDTLVDTTSAVLAAYEEGLGPLREALAKRGLAPAGDGRWEELLRAFGSRLPRELFYAWLMEAGYNDGDREGLLGVATDIYWRRVRRLRPFPDAAELLEWLAAAGIGRGIISDGRVEEQRAKLEDTGLARYFGPTFISGQYPLFQGKPAAAMYRDALTAAGEPPATVMFVGDRDKDIIGANIAGMTSVKILQGWANRRPAAEQLAVAVPDYTVYRLADIKAIITGRQG